MRIRIGNKFVRFSDGFLKRKKGPIAKFHKNPTFKRNTIPPQYRQALLRELRVKLKDPLFVKSLEKVSGDVYKYWFSYKGKKWPVIIKGTKEYPGAVAGIREHGRYYKKFRSDIVVHQQAVRRGELDASEYILRTPKAYGLIANNFVVMEYIEENMECVPYKQLRKAQDELKNNFIELCDRGLIKDYPQTSHFMPVAEEAGRVVFYSAYDYA